MKRKLFLIGTGLSTSLIIPYYAFSNDIRDTLHMPGGISRGLKCLKSGALITYNYLSVKQS
jgi:hypothetical protein